MKPKEFLDKLEEEMLKASADTKNIHAAAYMGAQRMWELCNKREREWREVNREKLRTYNREYARVRRAKKKEMEAGIDRIADMK